HTVAGVSALAFTVLAAATVGSAPAGAGHLIGGLTSGAVLAGVLRCTVFRVGVVAGGDGRPRTAAAAPTYPLAAGYLAATVTLTVGAIGAAGAAFSGAPVEAIGPALALTGLLLLTSAPRRPGSPSPPSRPRATTSTPAIWTASTTTSARAAPTVSGHADRSRPLTSCSTGSSAHARGSRGFWRPRASSVRWAPSWRSPGGPGPPGGPRRSRSYWSWCSSCGASVTPIVSTPR